MIRKFFIAILLFFFCFNLQVLAQIDTSDPGFKKFYHDNGQVSSMGVIEDGKPNGYWKTFYTDGTLKSEGNRKNFKLDSTWKFYNENGNLSMIINYKEGNKHGKKINYSDEEIIKENLKNGVKDGWKKIYFKDSTLKRKVYFKKGKKDGYEKVYNKIGRLISLLKFDNGFLVSREFINRKDKQGRKQGTWKTFYPDGDIKFSGNYLDGKKNGIFKKYDKKGNLVSIEKYEKGDKVVEDKETADYKIKRDFYESGEVKTKATFLDGKMDGVRREYDKNGNVIESYIMDEGNVVGKGIVDKEGLKQGNWKEYYDSGKLKAKGKYKDDVKIGLWVYYYKNGKIEQKGHYNEKGKPTGEWKWYYRNGQLRKKEEMKDGISDGMYKEFTRDGELWAKGKYVNGLKEGSWTVHYLGIKEKGKYQNDVRQGMWKKFNNDTLIYKGRFEDGLPDGKHTDYWKSGEIQAEGTYNMGEKNGEWKRYNRKGELFLIITYKFGKEVKYNNKSVEIKKEKRE